VNQPTYKTQPTPLKNRFYPANEHAYEHKDLHTLGGSYTVVVVLVVHTLGRILDSYTIHVRILGSRTVLEHKIEMIDLASCSVVDRTLVLVGCNTWAEVDTHNRYTPISSHPTLFLFTNTFVLLLPASWSRRSCHGGSLLFFGRNNFDGAFKLLVEIRSELFNVNDPLHYHQVLGAINGH
ncbi:hypothetical protein HID58_044930, partial [Brassica napus]